MDFKEWFEEEKDRYALKLDFVSSKKGFKAGQQSKQAEIDELKKRIDNTLSKLNDFRNKGVDQACYEAIKILKGESK